jgi:hypothetical protein
MSLLNVVMDSQEEKIYFHYKHITRSLPIKTGYDNKWYVVADDEIDLQCFITCEIVELCELHSYIGFNNAINTHELINVLKENNIPFSSI